MTGRRAARTLLALSYVFPPSAYVGVYRILKYCKYLGAHGWLPIVITPHAGDAYRDDRLSAEIPAAVEVRRTRDLDPAKLLRQFRESRERLPGSHRQVGGPRAASGSSSRARSRFKDFILGLLLESPDSHVFWLPFAFVCGIRVLLTRRIDVIYSSSPPHSSHIAAFLLATVFRKPYILDFRDPWEISGPVAGLMRWLKKLVVCQASTVVTVSQGERAELLAELPDVDPRHVVVITNGYDPDDFECLTPAPRQDSKLRITHVGTIHRGAGGEFFDALNLLLLDDPRLAEWLNVMLVGEADGEYRTAVDELERAGVVSRMGFVPHASALELALASDVLLVLLGGDRFAPSELPAKLSEYLYIGKPILAVAKPGELWDVLNNSGSGITVPPYEAPALARAITRLRHELLSRSCLYKTDRQYIERFDRRALVGQFASVLDAVGGRT